MDAYRIGAIAALVAGLMAWPLPISAEPTDLREFRIGMALDELPGSGYLDFACATAPTTGLSGWGDYRRCPADAAGRREVRFQYDEAANPMARINDDYEGTKIGGHPVLISLVFGDAGRVDGIRIRTDPKARLYLKKKAFLFGRQAMERYGEDGWSCTKSPPQGNEEPVGGMFIKDHCEKVTDARRLVLDRELFRRHGEALRNFVSNTTLAILAKD